MLRQLARFKAKNYPEYLQASVVNKSLSRWWGMLAISLQRIVIDSIIRLQGADLHAAADSMTALPLEDLLDFHL